MNNQGLSLSLEGRAIVVTGAGSGIGREAATLFARLGARVLCVDLDEASATDTARADPEHLTPWRCDVTDEDAVEAMADGCVRTLGALDGLFANAGMNGPGSLAETSLEQWQRVLTVNLTSVFLCARAAVRVMPETGGSIVNTASVAGIAGIASTTSYSASKGGVVALTRQLALDLGDRNIRVNAVCPGLVPTPLSRASRATISSEPVDDQLARIATTYPLQRLGRVEDVSRLAAFLLSDQAGWMTGAVIPVDGGLTA